MHGRLATVVCLGFLSVALAGCSGGGGDGGGDGAGRDASAPPLSPEEAHDQAESALLAFQASLADPLHGDLKAIRGTFDAPVDYEDPSKGTQEVDLLWEWGSNGVVHMEITTDSPAAYGVTGDSATVSFWCAPGRMVFQVGEQVFETPSEDESGCMDPEQLQSDPFAFAQDVPGLSQDVRVNPDGSLTATYEDEAGNVGVFHVDRAGRLTDMDVEGPDFSGHLELVYGELEPLDVPEASEDFGGLFGG